MSTEKPKKSRIHSKGGWFKREQDKYVIHKKLNLTQRQADDLALLAKIPEIATNDRRIMSEMEVVRYGLEMLCEQYRPQLEALRKK